MSIFLKQIYRAVFKLFAFLFKLTKMFTKPLTRGPQYILIKSPAAEPAAVIFASLCYWRRSLCSNLRGIDPEKPHRATKNAGFRTRSPE